MTRSYSLDDNYAEQNQYDEDYKHDSERMQVYLRLLLNKRRCTPRARGLRVFFTAASLHYVEQNEDDDDNQDDQGNAQQNLHPVHRATRHYQRLLRVGPLSVRPGIGLSRTIRVRLLSATR